ncbi:stage V sporulation protein SpoVM [Caldibacillus thermoamylovorans]|nr:stage V sporulation protein SpoVM [Caldibacillus thermoamylovorans]PAC38037.1 stage V sporulation protein M [Caldifermentibacillus hisashii]
MRIVICLRILLFVSGREYSLKFYTIKLPRFLGGFIRAILGTFKKG